MVALEAKTEIVFNWVKIRVSIIQLSAPEIDFYQSIADRRIAIITSPATRWEQSGETFTVVRRCSNY
jgi:hypothetical protein